jgi:hypothetical protein
MMRGHHARGTAFTASALRRSACVPVILLLAAGPSAVVAQDDGQPRWYSANHGTQARLIYGVPERGKPPLIFICDRGVAPLSAYLAHPAASAATGTPLSVRLAGGSTTVDFPATVAEMDPRRLSGQVMLDPPLETILASSGQLTVSAGGRTLSYPLAGAAAAAAPILALCGSAARASPADLSVTVTNRSRRRITQIALRDLDSIELDTDSFGYDGLAPGQERTFTIPGGAGICAYEISVSFAEKECCSDPRPVGQQNLCDDPRLAIHD